VIALAIAALLAAAPARARQDAGPAKDHPPFPQPAAKRKGALTAAQIASALKTKGRVTDPDLVFDAGKASIKQESMPALAVIAEVLKNDSSLKLEIHAHADDLTVAEGRANAVKVLLIVNHGVADQRLTSTGVRDARSDVELIKK
jgi:outer membrane protein OmpA-like peptidoglycan-associated protein